MLFWHLPLLTKFIPSGKFLFAYCSVFMNLEGNALPVYFSSTTQRSFYRLQMKMVITQTSVGLVTHWYLACPSSNSWRIPGGVIQSMRRTQEAEEMNWAKCTHSWITKFTHITLWLFVVEKDSKTFVIVTCFICFISVRVVSKQIWKQG